VKGVGRIEASARSSAVEEKKLRGNILRADDLRADDLRADDHFIGSRGKLEPDALGLIGFEGLTEI
jgi:hypothetical protein